MLSKRLLCEQNLSLDGPKARATAACGACRACQLHNLGNHPDYITVRAYNGESVNKTESYTIKVEQIRELEERVYLNIGHGNRRVIMIDKAQEMNEFAQNALLKILEDCSIYNYFLIITHQYDSLLPTLRSRCSLITLPRPDARMLEQWSRQQENREGAQELWAFMGGAPLVADNAQCLRQFELACQTLQSLAKSNISPLQLAETWDATIKKQQPDIRLEDVVQCLQKITLDLAFCVQSLRLYYFPERRHWMDKLAPQARLPRLLLFYQELTKAKKASRAPLNQRLFLDDLAIRLLRATS